MPRLYREKINLKPNYIMIKKLSSFLLPLAVALTGCSQGADEPAPKGEAEGGMQKVEMALSRASADELQAAGISKFTVFIYQVNRREYTLVEMRECGTSEGRFQLDFPLGETYTTFAVANADNFTDTESYENVTVHIDPAARQDVWISNPVRFSSDKSFSTLDVALRRVIASVDFQTAETAADIAATGDFDRLDVTFDHVATSYRVNGAAVNDESVTLTVDAASDFKGGFSTFPTTALADPWTVTINYFKGGQQVNTSSSALETNEKFASDTHYTVTVPVTDNGFVQTPWRSASLIPAGSRMKISVVATPL